MCSDIIREELGELKKIMTRISENQVYAHYNNLSTCIIAVFIRACVHLANNCNKLLS